MSQKVSNARDPRTQKQLDQNIEDLELPASHAFTHKTGGDDELTPGDISAETPAGAQDKVDTHEAKDNPHSDSASDTDLNNHTSAGNPHSDSQPIDSGTTANRPSVSKIGYQYFDTDLGHAIWWGGSNWVDATGATV